MCSSFLLYEDRHGLEAIKEDRQTKENGTEHACVGIILKDAVNGKAVHGTGGVNYLPHMLVFLVCFRNRIWLKSL